MGETATAAIGARRDFTLGEVAVAFRGGRVELSVPRSGAEAVRMRFGLAETDLPLIRTWLREAGMTTAMVDTGGDPGHAPARRTYESAGFRVLPIARYLKKL